MSTIGIGPNSAACTALFSKARSRILCLLLLNSEKRYYHRQIVTLTGLGIGSAQRELGNLVAAGIILRIPEGRQVYYCANLDCPIFPELKRIIIMTSGVGQIIMTALQSAGKSCQVAFIYGSVAAGTDRCDSDIDLMIIGSVSFARVCKIIDKAQGILHREINPTVYPATEFKKKLNTPFIKSVVQNRKIFLIGDERDLERLAQ